MKENAVFAIFSSAQAQLWLWHLYKLSLNAVVRDVLMFNKFDDKYKIKSVLAYRKYKVVVVS